MPYVLIWPEAQGKYNENASIASKLQDCQNEIDKAKNAYFYDVSKSLSPSLKGEYYDEYEKKAIIWRETDVNKILNEFESISSQLSSRINNAIGKRDLWASRIGKTRWVPENE